MSDGVRPRSDDPRPGDPRRAAVVDPGPLRPGDRPGLGHRLLVLFDADCGFCLAGRDRMARWDRRGRLAFDLIQRHADGLLGDLDEQTRMASWHVVHPDGRRESAGAAQAAVLGRLPGGGLPARLLRALPGPAERAYRLVADHRTSISHRLGTDRHPERGRLPG